MPWFNIIGGMLVIASGGFLTGARYGACPQDPNKWRAAWIYTGTLSAIAFGAVAIVTSIVRP